MAKIIYNQKEGQRKIKLRFHQGNADVDVIDVASGETLDNVESVELPKFTSGRLLWARVTLIVTDLEMEMPTTIEDNNTTRP
jgi:hypothetical protein